MSQLLDTIAQAFQQRGWTYYFNENVPNYFKTGFQDQNENYFQCLGYANNDCLMVHVPLLQQVPQEKWHLVEELLNRANQTLWEGVLTLNYDDGIVIVNSGNRLVNGNLSCAFVNKVLDFCTSVTTEFHFIVQRVVAGEISPESAIEEWIASQPEEYVTPLEGILYHCMECGATTRVKFQEGLKDTEISEYEWEKHHDISLQVGEPTFFHAVGVCQDCAEHFFEKNRDSEELVGGYYYGKISGMLSELQAGQEDIGKKALTMIRKWLKPLKLEDFQAISPNAYNISLGTITTIERNKRPEMINLFMEAASRDLLGKFYADNPKIKETLMQSIEQENVVKSYVNEFLGEYGAIEYFQEFFPYSTKETALFKKKISFNYQGKPEVIATSYREPEASANELTYYMPEAYKKADLVRKSEQVFQTSLQDVDDIFLNMVTEHLLDKYAAAYA